MATLDDLITNGFDADTAIQVLSEADDLELVELPDPLEFLMEGVGLAEDEAVDLLCELEDAPLENAFYSAAQRKWYFANLGKKGGTSGAKGGKGGDFKGGPGAGKSIDKGDDSPAKRHAGGVANSTVVKTVEKKYPPANPQGVDSFDRHKTADGFTPERTALHDKIIEELKGAAKPAKGTPVFTMMGGGPASGKSSIIKGGQVKVPEGVKADSDEIKGKLPEYEPLVAAGDYRAASYAHEESSYLAKRLIRESMEEKSHVTLDGTGNSNYASVEKKVAEARAAGYRAEAVYVTVSTEEAIRRNRERAKKTGRLPPEDMLRNTHKSVSQIVPEALKNGLFDKFELWDTEQKGGPVKVVSAKGKNVTVHDQKLYDKFLAKGKE